MIIILHWSGWLRDPKVERAAMWRDAQSYATALPDDRTALIFDTVAPIDPWGDLDQYRGRKLADIYKSLGGDLASDRFTNYESGRRRTEQLIERLAREAPEVQPPREEVMEEQSVTTEETKTRRPRRPRAFKPPVLGVFEPIRPATKLAAFLALASEGTRTLDDLATALGFDRVKVQQWLRSSLAKMHGIGHNIDEAGVVTIVLPLGRSLSSLTKPQAEPKPQTDGDKAPRRIRHDDAMERARTGEGPPHLVITSETNKHRQKAVDRLEKLAADGDWDGVRTFHMNGIDTYSKMINKHRDLLLAAHEAQEQQQTAA